MSMSRFLIPAYPTDDEGRLIVDRPLQGIGGDPVYREVFLGRVRQPGKASVQMHKFLDLSDTPPPPNYDYSSKALPGIRNPKGNNQQGDCVIASGGNGIAVWSGNDTDSPGLVEQSESEALSEYHRQGGPGDNGLVMSQALDDFMNHGLKAGGKLWKIDGWAGVRLDKKLIWSIGYIFGGHRLGFNVPYDWINGVTEGFVWRNPSRYNFVGGHDVRIVGANEQGLKVATWGLLGIMEWDAVLNTNIVDEIDVELAPLWYNNDKITPSKFNVSGLQSAITMVRNGQVPSWQPDPVPPSPPAPPVPPTPPIPSSITIPELAVRIFGVKVGHTDSVTITLLAAQSAIGDIDWRVVAKDVAKLITDASTAPVDWALCIQDAWQIVSDLHLFSSSRGSAPNVSWFQIAMDAYALVRAAIARDVPGVIAALLKLASDFGIAMTPEQITPHLRSMGVAV